MVPFKRHTKTDDGLCRAVISPNETKLGAKIFFHIFPFVYITNTIGSRSPGFTKTYSIGQFFSSFFKPKQIPEVPAKK